MIIQVTDEVYNGLPEQPGITCPVCGSKGRLVMIAMTRKGKAGVPSTTCMECGTELHLVPHSSVEEIGYVAAEDRLTLNVPHYHSNDGALLDPFGFEMPTWTTLTLYRVLRRVDGMVFYRHEGVCLECGDAFVTEGKRVQNFP